MLLYFVRHGQTEANIQGIIQGQLDTPLNDRGRLEAARLAEHFKDIPFTEAWTSSLSRARETAEIVVVPHDGVLLKEHSGLMERGLGSAEGKRWPKGVKVPADGENTTDFASRVVAWFKAFLKSHPPSSTPADSVILIVSHSAFLGYLKGMLTVPRLFNFSVADGVDVRRPCLNTSFMRVRLTERDGRWDGVMESCWEVDHLHGMVKRDLQADNI